jgi:hypothetical protein
VAGTASAVSGRVRARQQERYAAPEPPPPAAPQQQPVGAVGDDAISQLERLARLKEQGVLTEQEFAAQKAKILGG